LFVNELLNPDWNVPNCCLLVL